MIVTVHRGTREIGGNCVEVASSSTRLILDVGLPLVNEQRAPFDSLKALRSSREQLIADGTHLGGEKEQGTTEFELEERVVELVKTAPGLVLAAFSPQDVDRLVTLYHSAQRTGRIFVADAYAAFILHLVAGEANIPRPTRDKGIRVYFNTTFRKKNIERLNQLFDPDRIGLEEILADPGKHLSSTDADFRPLVVIGLGSSQPEPPR